jgi:hypothetical protein
MPAPSLTLRSQLPGWFSWGAGVLGLSWVGAVALVPACTPPAAPRVVASVQPISTGNPQYDRFFGEVNEVWRSVESAERELPEARAALARRVGLPDDAPADVLGARLRERTARLASEGLTLELEFAGIAGADGAEDDAPEPEPSARPANGIPTQPPATPTATLRTPGREPERRELRLLEVVAQAALSAATVYAEMGTLQRRTRPLEDNAAALRNQVDASFADAALRTRVQQDLADADALLGKSNERSRALANAADTLVSLLDEAANTASVRRRPGSPSAPRPATPRDSAPPPAERPGRASTPKPEPAQDFEP